MDLVHRPGKGEVHQDGPEAHGKKEGGLHILFDSQVDKQAADGPHQHLLPGEEQQILVEDLHW